MATMIDSRPDYDRLILSDRISGQIYYDPAIFRDELEKIWAETGKTIIFVTHNVREAVRLGDRVVLMTFRPGTVKCEYQVDLPRPRHLEDVQVAGLAREILDDLREEINKSLEEEYGL